MPRIPQNPNHLLTQLEAAKHPTHSTQIQTLLSKLSNLQLDPHQLIRFHESLLFLRAFPHAPAQIPRLENLLNTFQHRIEKLRAADADMSIFDDFDASGIAGTTMQDTLSFDVSQWLVSRIPQNVEIAWSDYWDDYQSERARGNTWPRFIPLLEEDADVEANIPWQNWIDAARGRQNALPWLLNQFAKLPLPARQQSELYDSLRLPLRWNLENLKLSRTRNWTTPRHFYFHTTPLIQRSEVNLAQELSKPAPKLEKLSRQAGEQVMHHIREVMVVRYRELYGTTLGDPKTVVRANLGRGVVMHFWGLPPTRCLPLRAYVAGYTLKNGVPINYIEAIGLCEWIEVGFNTFYTYRQGETAWIYAQALHCLQALTKAKCFSIYPYQIGQNNDEAIASGAFWFYRKLGFRPGRPDLEKLCEKEEKRIAANPNYRTPARTLKRLAEAHMFYETYAPKLATADRPDDQPRSGARMQPRAQALGKSKKDDQAPKGRKNNSGPWDTFSTRTLGLRINRRMSREFNGDSQKIRQASTATITKALRINSSSWTPAQKQSLENWSVVLAQIPNLSRWTREEKRKLVRIIQAKSAPTEIPYLRQTQHHPRLREALLRLGSNPGLSFRSPSQPR
jgi:hypothetical protein